MSTQMQGYHPVSSGSPSANGLYASNPYRNQTYVKSPWQNFLTSLGFRTQADAWQENMNVQAAEYDAAIAQKLYDQEYNDPQSQVARMRAAGLNPDLNGGDSIDSGHAASIGEDPSTPMQSTGDDAQIMQLANGVLSAFSTSLGLVNSIQGVARNRIQNQILSVQGEKTYSDVAKELAVSLIPITPDDLFDSDGNMVGDWKSNALQSAKLFTRRMPKKVGNKLLSEIEHFWNTAPITKEAYQAWSDRVSSRKDYAMNSQTFYSEIDSLLMEISKPLAEMSENIYQARQNADFEGASAEYEENQNRAEYANQVDPSTAAASTNAVNRAAKGQADIQDTLRKTMNSIMSNLEKSSRDGGIKGTMSQFMLIMMAMQQMQMLPSVGSVIGMFK